MTKRWLIMGAIGALALVAFTRPAWGAAPLIPIHAITRDLVGQEVQVQGRVIDVAKPRADLYELVVQDDTGKINLRLTRSIYESVPLRAWLNENAELAATARVGVDAHGLYLQPSSGKNVTILSPGSSAQVPVRPANRPAPVGSIVAIEGRIVDRPPAPFGLLLHVADDTGSVTVRILSSVLKFVPHAERLVVGAPVRVVGRVEWQRGLQVVPMLGEDVIVR